MIQKSRLEEMLFEVAQNMNILCYHSSFSYSSNHFKGIYYFKKSDIKEEERLCAKNLCFEIPECISENELVLTGYFAHELAHLKLLKKSHLNFIYG